MFSNIYGFREEIQELDFSEFLCFENVFFKEEPFSSEEQDLINMCEYQAKN